MLGQLTAVLSVLAVTGKQIYHSYLHIVATIIIIDYQNHSKCMIEFSKV